MELDVAGICEVLEGKVRGNPVAISLFPTEIHSAYQARKVDPCAILRYAMDEGELVHFDRQNQDCLHGAYITGVHEGTDIIRTGHLLSDNIEAYTEEAAYRVNSGKFILPQGTVIGIGAAPLAQLPEDMTADWLAVVCTPFWASTIAAARAVEDGTPPSGAAGSSFCSELFVTPWYEENVVMTPGDVGGRMNNKLKPEEMFVIIPTRWANNLIKLLGTVPNAKRLYEQTRPDDSEYWEKQARKAKRAEQFHSAVQDKAREHGLKISMPWEESALDMLLQSPKFVRGFAVDNVEDFAREQNYKLITEGVVREQMESAGVSKFLKFFKRGD